MMKAVHSSTPWNRKNRYSAPSIPPAGSCTSFSADSRTDPVKSPTHFADEAEKKIQTKDEVLAELMAEHVALKKDIGEL